MKNLTNLQLQVLTGEVFDRLRDSLDAFKATPAYQKELDLLRAEINYKKVAALIKKREVLEAERDEIDDKLNHLELKYKKVSDSNAQGYSYMPRSMKSFDDVIEKKILAKQRKNWPSQSKVQSQIVLAGISGVQNILETVVKKLGLELED